MNPMHATPSSEDLQGCSRVLAEALQALAQSMHQSRSVLFIETVRVQSADRTLQSVLAFTVTAASADGDDSDEKKELKRNVLLNPI